jgi:hypothetical protein
MEFTLCNETLGANATTEEDAVVINPGADFAINAVLLHAKVVVAAGGAECDAYVQTRVGGSWIDIANFHATTSSLERLYNLSTRTPVTSIATPANDASHIADNTAVDGLIGDLLRVKLVTSGTAYTGASSIKVTAVVR